MWIQEPTKRKAMCVCCRKTLSGYLPRLTIIVHSHRFGDYTKYICLECSKHDYESAFCENKVIIDKYEKLLESDKWRNIAVAEGL
jgi:hypothetical protein